MTTMTAPEGTKLSTVPLDWKEVYYTNCPLVSASNVDQELGWAKEQSREIGISVSNAVVPHENDRYPHYVHNLDNLIRFEVSSLLFTFRRTSAEPGSSA